MSYILEALKKAQAERQLGSAPGVHAVPVGAIAHAAAAPKRKPLWIALVGTLVLAAIGLTAWRMQPAPAVRTVVAQQTVAPPPAVVPPPAAAPPIVVAAAPLIVQPQSAPVPKPAPPKPAPVVKADKPKEPPKEPPKPAPEEDKVPAVRELPDAVQRSLPTVAFGGYMYSANPADRLLLVDKTLRHEGEEVAPGLILEKLLPKAAVMNYRGTRYKVPY